MTETPIKPCPFCAGTDIRFDAHPHAGRGLHHYDATVYSMCCYNCGATFPNRYRKQLLVDAWNRRDLAPSEPDDTLNDIATENEAARDDEWEEALHADADQT